MPKFANTRRLLTCAGLILYAPIDASAGGFALRPAASGYSNAAGGGFSLGGQLSDDTWLWGWSADYSRNLSDKWVINVAIAFDRETERQPGADKVVDSYSFTAAVGYALTPRLHIGTGFGHGLYNTDTPDESWKRVDFGDDFATGLLFSYSLWQKGRHDISPSAALEYNISDKKWALTFDFGYSYSF